MHFQLIFCLKMFSYVFFPFKLFFYLLSSPFLLGFRKGLAIKQHFSRNFYSSTNFSECLRLLTELTLGY